MVRLKCLSGEKLDRRYAVYSDSRYVGGITVYPVPGQPDLATYGILICRQFRRQGLATEALRQLFRELTDLGCREVWARIEPGNTASLALHRSLGFCPCPAEEPGTVTLCLSLPAPAGADRVCPGIGIEENGPGEGINSNGG